MSTGGYIYAIGASSTPLVKIGSAKNVEQRRRMLQTGQPFSLHVVAAIPVAEDVQRVEKQVHAFLADARQHGEWFDVPMDEAQLAALVLRVLASLAEQTDSSLGEKTTRQILGERLLLRRRHLQLSQQELAERCGFPYQVISGLERERQSIYAERLKILAQVLGVSADYLLGLSDQEHDDAMGSMGGALTPAAVALVGA